MARKRLDSEPKPHIKDDGGFIENDFKEDGTPCLFIDREYILSGMGQIRTRVQAFLETLGR